MKASGGCHCGAVRFEVEFAEPVELLICNCSICSMTAYEHLIVPESQFVLECGEEMLTSYRFGTRQAEHLFCAACGIKSFYRPRSHPGCFSVNFKCLDGIDQSNVIRRDFDGRNWEKARSRLH